MISVSAMSEGAEILLTFAISDSDGRIQKKKILLFTEQYLDLGLKKGALVDEETFDRIEELSSVCKAMRKGSELLSYSPSSKRRLVQRLRDKGMDSKSAEVASYELEKLGLVNEDADVSRAVESCLKKLWGRSRIYKTLISKGYEHQYVSAHVGNVEKKVFIKNCAALIQKKYKGIPRDVEERRKMINSLMRYGYSYNEIKGACDFLKKNE